ncbi:hypothetical protein IGB42_00929 [Andreprevotia sp. IGB-42]|uniref:cytoplasmic protein n=1 Tax=Andreprevotia sp. IGB-42 TaxID=2497473 RepID=UPI00135684E5|nr:cytoplasmic protein [Andreprevotia sp. IGB-42]KAF0814873.1 hypothetical protein IGB42_00929 [Andreprevotia sp. IGB-42]
MQKYRLIIWRHDEMLGFFETETPRAREAVDQILQHLPSREGFRVEVQTAQGERRILESGPDGLRVLGTETLFKSAALAL